MSDSALHPKVVEVLHRLDVKYKVLECDPDFADTAVFCKQYGYLEEAAANAIIVASRHDPVVYACCSVLATTKLDVNRKVKEIMDVRKVSFASADKTLELTGMMIGGVTPFALPEIPYYIDAKVMEQTEVIIGGGNRSSKLVVEPAELLKIPGARVIEGLAVAKVPV